MNVQEMRKTAAGIEEVARAVRQIDDPARRVRLIRALERAAGEHAEQAVEAVASAARALPLFLDEWAEKVGHQMVATTLSHAALRMVWKAEITERPDNLDDILKDRMERGMTIMPKKLLGALYALGASVGEIKAGRRTEGEVKTMVDGLMSLAADWAARVEEAKDSEEGVIVCVAPF